MPFDIIAEDNGTQRAAGAFQGHAAFQRDWKRYLKFKDQIDAMPQDADAA